jgi:ABC-type transport system substrate-binding protein
MNTRTNRPPTSFTLLKSPYKAPLHPTTTTARRHWMPGDHITLTRFDGYYGPKPDWDNVSSRVIVNNAARTAALLSRDVDLIASVSGNDLANVQHVPESGVFPARRKTGLKRAAQRQFHRHQ